MKRMNQDNRNSRWQVGRLLLAVMAFAWAASTGWAQAYAPPRLSTLEPPGAQAGQTVEVELTGAELADVNTLHFSNDAIKAERVPDPEPDPKEKKNKNAKKKVYPTKFKVTVPANVPPGFYDAWAVSPDGISNCRVFAVGHLPETAEKENNNDVPEAQEIKLDTTINGVINNRVDVDYFKFEGKKDDRVVFVCQTWTIDSKLHPLLEVYDARGRKMVDGHDYLEDTVRYMTLPSDGEYTIRLAAFAYQYGAADAFYRLTVTRGPWIESVYPAAIEPGKSASVTVVGVNLPQGKKLPGSTRRRPLESAVVNIKAPSSPLEYGPFAKTLFPRAFSLDGFEYRLGSGSNLSNPATLAFSSHPVILEKEPNDDNEATAQPVPVPCEISGRIDSLGDRDWYSFEAKKGDVIVIEGRADRLGMPIDLYFQIWRMDPEPKLVGEYDAHDDLPAMVNQFWTYTDDPRTRFAVNKDGKYLVQASSRTATIRAGPEYVYQLTIRHEEPDFRLVVVDNGEGDTGGFNLNQGSSTGLTAVLYRQDNFNGEVKIEAENLPNGVTMDPQVIGPKATQTALVLDAADNAPLSFREIRIKGTATINGKKITRAARFGTIVWPNTQKNAPAFSRLIPSLCVAVTKPGLFTMKADTKKIEVPLGGKTEIKLSVKRNMPKDNTQIAVTRIAGPVLTNGNLLNFPNLNIAGNKTDGTIKLNVANNVNPGTYNLVLVGKGKFKVKEKDSKKTKNVDYAVSAPAITFTVYDEVADLELDKDKITVKAGEKVKLRANFKRLYGYKGTFNLELVSKSGITAKDVKIAANQNDGTLEITAPANAKTKTDDLIVRLTARVNNNNFVHEATVQVAVLEQKKKKK